LKLLNNLSGSPALAGGERHPLPPTGNSCRVD
jgi:hypothetical protein